MSYHQPDAPQVNPFDPVWDGYGEIEPEPDEHEDEADELNEPAIIPCAATSESDSDCRQQQSQRHAARGGTCAEIPGEEERQKVMKMLPLLGGCATQQIEKRTQQIEKRTASFSPAEFVPFQGQGSGLIKGSAFLKTRSGDVKVAAGNAVYLMPSTPYTDEWFNRSVVGGALIEQPVKLDKYQRQTRADATGNFQFTRLPPGKYYVTCAILWEYATGGYGSSLTGGVAYAVANVSPGGTANVVVTRAPPYDN